MHATTGASAVQPSRLGLRAQARRIRALAIREGERIQLISRNGRLIAENFPEVVNAIRALPGSWVLDGELVVPDARGHPSFEFVRRRGVMKLARSIAAAARATPALCAFDLLLKDGMDLPPHTWQL